MSKRRSKKNKEQIVRYESSCISQEKMIEIQAEAYYRALKRIENEKNESDEQNNEKKKYKWYEEIQFILNVLLWPWRINKKFNVSDRVYDSILVLFVWGVLKFIGGVMWIVGVIAFIGMLWQIITIGFVNEFISTIPIVIISLLLGSVFVLAGDAFSKETDSNKIYAYSASIIALISCIVSIIAMIGM